MRVFLPYFVITASVWAQPANLSVVGTTPTQSVLSYTMFASDSCLVEVSESPGFQPPVNDVNPSLFPGANTDAGRSVQQGGTRLVVIGKRVAEPSQGHMVSRALRSAVTHYVRITCNGGASTIQFRTANAAGMAPEAPPFHPAADGNFAVPDFDWSDRSKPVIDPQTGVAIYRVADPHDYSSDTPYYFPYATYFQGANWTNPLNLPSANPNIVATTSSTSPVFLPIDSTYAFVAGGWGNTATQSHPVTDLAIRFFGNASDPNPENRTLLVCLSIDSGGTCWSNSIEVVVPTGAPRDFGLTPASYPNAIFSAWGKPITREFFTSIGRLTAAAGSVTLVKDELGNPINTNSQSARSRFQVEWPTGAKIFIANSAPTCPNQYCTIVSVSSQTHLTVAENLTVGESSYKFAGLGFRIAKKTPFGSVGISASYRVAKSYILHQGTSSGCSTSTVDTSVDRSGRPLGRSLAGFLCIFPMMFESGGRLYFAGASEPDFRLLSLIKQPATIAALSPVDLPNAVAEIAGPNSPSFDVKLPSVFYTGIPARSETPALFKLTYNGDFRENSAVFWNSSVDSTPAAGSPNITWDNVTRSSEQGDLRAQILTKTRYNETIWGPLTTSRLNFVGMARGYAIFNSTPVGGQDTPCWIFTFQSRTGSIVRAWNTLNGGGEGSLGGGCHSVQIAAGRILVANSGLRQSNASRQWGGPFDASITTLRRSGSFSSNTALPTSFDGSYDGGCPADLADRWKQIGATGNECVTLRIAGEPCSSFATNLEKIWTPCPGAGDRSWVGAPIGEGQEFFDATRNFDDEHLMVVRRTNLPTGEIELVLLRDAGNGYCCQAARARGRKCLASPGQAVHSNGWALRLTPRGSCGSCSQLYDPATGSYVVEDQNLTRGHFSYALLASGNHTYLGTGNDGYVARYDAPPSEFGKTDRITNIAQWPSFAGIASQSLRSSLQSYISAAGAPAEDFETRFATDWRHPNGSLGLAPEAYGQTIGDPYTLTLEPGTSTVYKVSRITGLYDPKRTPLIVWAGRYVFAEKSSPLMGNTLNDADQWHFCYAYRTGECRLNSAAGSLYVAAPKLDTSLNACHASQISYRSLCVFAGVSVFGQIMQLRIDQDDPHGLWQRRLGYGLTRPGSQYVYSSAKSSPDGKGIFATAWNLQGVYSLPVYLSLPPWPNDQVNRTTFVPVVANGNGYVEFGYEEFGAKDQFFCTARAEACRTAAENIDVQRPFVYAHEPLQQASGNKISIPAIPGRVLYYRLVTSGVPGPTQVAVVP